MRSNKGVYAASITKTVCQIGLLCLLMLAAPAIEAETVQQASVGDYEQTDCFFDTGVDLLTPEQLGFECGYVTVPEQHAEPDGPTIRIPVAINRTTSETPQPDPVFLAQGGPGGDAFAIFALVAPNSTATANRDVVIFNQRGTQYAEPRLDCTELTDVNADLLVEPDVDESNRLYIEALTACRDRLVNEGVNLSAYDSLENAADVELIRQALGYETYNFYGVSYGTLLGLHLMRLNPPSLRSVILDAVVPTQTNFVPNSTQSENAAYDEHLAACTEDPDCVALYPNLETRLFAVYEQLNTEPAMIELTDADSGETYPMLLTGDAVKGLVFQLFYVEGFYAVLPRLTADLEKGEYTAIENLASLFYFDDSFSNGMYFSVVCAEDGDFTADDVSLDGVRPFLADNAREDAESFLDACALWDVETLPDSVDDPVESDIPTLLMSGRFDPITPASYAEQAVQTLPNGYHVVSPFGAHGNAITGDECAGSITASFLDNPMQSPDTSCFAEGELIEPIDLDAIPVSVLGKIGNLETNAMIQLGAVSLFALVLLSDIVLWPMVVIVRKLRGRQEIERSQGTRWLRHLLVFLTGATMVVLLGGLVFNVGALIENSAYLLYGVMPSSARWVFMLTPVVLVFAVLAIVFLARSWRVSSIFAKIYYCLLLICLLGVSGLLFSLDLFSPLFA